MLLVPEALWERLLEMFRATDRSVEQIAYLDGLESGASSVVTTITVPNGVLREQSYRVSPDAMSEAGKHLREHSLVRLAQVHTHPGSWVGHSPEDDRRADSQEGGAGSIVLPDYWGGGGTVGGEGFPL